MGAPKQKWTSEEEAALKAGVAKYGVGKWSTILKDPEFSVVLRSRSNVDLKPLYLQGRGKVCVHSTLPRTHVVGFHWDKWRNLHVMASGWGSRHRGRVVSKSARPTPKHDNNTLVSSVGENAIEVLDAKPLASSGDVLKDVDSKKPLSSCRLDDLILEAIAKLKEPRGSSRNAISSYIEERFVEPPNFERQLASNLKALTEKGRLIKTKKAHTELFFVLFMEDQTNTVKHQYRVAPSRVSSDAKGGRQSLLMGGKHDSTMVEKNETRILTKAQVDADLEQMKSMSAEEAAAVAARFVAEAEVAIADAERAARIAEEYEAEAEAAQCFAEVAMKALQHHTIPIW
ncbi:hypothetical protein RND71_019572 [Anisodus tanguticus]|uniref:MYB transcription factor n=1 Tax=Anisodus tanguticus TaxID=243964 RepID=A0AAE1RZA8_9SOLA|nr:hypothetical protein RND71_019572 [Anisodus tanguticus]